MACVMASLLIAPHAAAQTYPVRPIRIVTAEAGGSSDLASRLVAQWLTSAFGQQVIVDNRGASGGIIAAQMVARSQRRLICSHSSRAR